MRAIQRMNSTPDEIRRCHLEIAAIEAEFANGNPDVRGLNLGWLDWQIELRIILKETSRG